VIFANVISSILFFRTRYQNYADPPPVNVIEIFTSWPPAEIAVLILTTSITDYLSLWKTRYILTSVAGLRRRLTAIAVVIVDFILTSLLYVVGGIIQIIILSAELIIIEKISRLDFSQLFEGVIGLFNIFMSILEPSQHTHLLIFYAVALWTSAWLWIYVLASQMMRTFSYIPIYLAIVSKVADLDKHPVPYHWFFRCLLKFPNRWLSYAIRAFMKAISRNISSENSHLTLGIRVRLRSRVWTPAVPPSDLPFALRPLSGPIEASQDVISDRGNTSIRDVTQKYQMRKKRPFADGAAKETRIAGSCVAQNPCQRMWMKRRSAVRQRGFTFCALAAPGANAGFSRIVE
jgi:hypothetical protein